jgi:hypothetical protein
MKTTFRKSIGGLLVAAALTSTVMAQDAITFDSNFDSSRLKEQGAKGGIVENALKVEFPAGKGYPAVHISAPAGAAWDFSKFTGLEAELTNPGETPVKVAFRVDNEGDWQKGPWNVESITVKPGESKTLKVSFGRSYGGGPGYELDASKIIRLVFFAENPGTDGSILVKSIKPFGPKS